MGNEITILNPVIAPNSIFIISSFFAFSSSISSRVISRVSISERSSCCFFLPKALTGSTVKDRVCVRVINDDALEGANAALGVAVRVATNATRANRSENREKVIVIIVKAGS